MAVFASYSCLRCLCYRCIHFVDRMCCYDHPEVKCPDMPGHDPGYICPDYREEDSHHA